jgi:hypothetical protein
MNEIPAASDPARLRASMRRWGNFLLIWRLCGKPACRRAHACHGNACACFANNFLLLPEGVRAWFDGVGEAQKAHEPFEEAMERLDGTDAGEALREWYEAVATSVGSKQRLPAQWWCDEGWPSGGAAENL